MLFQAAKALSRTSNTPVITHRVYFDIAYAGKELGRVEMGLYGVDVPTTVENFYELTISEDPTMGYLESIFYHVNPGSDIYGGDFIKGDGTGGKSIFGESFPRENFQLKHDRGGLLSMIKRGDGTNDSQFCISIKKNKKLDGKNVVFGEVLNGMNVVEYISKVPIDRRGKPLNEVKIVSCGELETVPIKQEEALRMHEKLEEEVKDREESFNHDEL